ncbi:alpha/beta fold hydrolase [Paenibacillus sp. UNC499MF]|uniref:alpha/beta fold hydrolase n=1 Tax=Paenibacillus sp. UNC499MF TaxID=1502751 RepID=UPI0021564B93|nr:alpha/beta hydrolase [Paenibacillus sp. UNC499MF]
MPPAEDGKAHDTKHNPQHNAALCAEHAGLRSPAEHASEQRINFVEPGTEPYAKHKTGFDKIFTSKHHKGDEQALAYSPKSGSILWLGGWSMPPSVFRDVQRELAEFRHFAADYGSAESPQAIADSARRLALSLRASEPRDEQRGLAPSRPLLIAGWSLGGLLAMVLASEGLADGLVLLGTTACFVRQPAESLLGWPPASVQAMIPALREDADGVLRQFRRLMFTKEERRDGLHGLLPEESGWSVPGLIAGLELLAAEDVRSRLPDIQCPVLLVHGTHDKVCPLGAALEIQSGVPQALLMEASGCGHVPFLQKERQTAETIRSWWNDSAER